MIAFHRQRQKLNNLSYSDYEAVDCVKMAYVKEIFAERGQQTLDSKDFKVWFIDNKDWLEPYAKWTSDDVNIIYYLHIYLNLDLNLFEYYS